MCVDDRDMLVSASLDCTVVLWDLYSKAMRKKLHGHHKGVYALAYDHENTLLFSAGFEHDAYVV